MSIDTEDRSTLIGPTAARGPVFERRFTPGTLIGGRYRIVALLGEGGMGEVYRADDLRLGQQVALKCVLPSLAATSHSLERLCAEVRIGRQISHPNVCRLYDIVEIEGKRAHHQPADKEGELGNGGAARQG